MTTEEELKKTDSPAAEPEESSEPAGDTDGVLDKMAPNEHPNERDANEEAPMQFGYKRFVYAAYMAGAMAVAFLVAKIGHIGWYRLGQWKPDFGEPKDEIVYSIAAIAGVVVALYYWRRQSTRQYANEVAEELSKVTWPTKKEVWNSTTVVILTALFATVFFALMDQFWRFVTDKIYSF
ncbi:MAG: preprotein translocase subunit SecE [Polyangiaceae bacterium]|nr:preprotein translocase subunit SecE [Polyangiaceae bacterium]